MMLRETILAIATKNNIPENVKKIYNRVSIKT